MNAIRAFEWTFSAIAVENLGWVLVHSLWQFAVVALVAGVIVRNMRRSSAATRYGVLVIAMAVSVAAPVATWVLQPSNSPPDHTVSRGTSVVEKDANAAINPAADDTLLASNPILESDPDREVSTPDRSTPSVASEALPIVSPSTPAVVHSTPSWSERATAVLRPWLAWIVTGWSLGVVMCSLRPLLGWHMLRRLQRVGVSPASDEVLSTMRRMSERLGLRCAVRVLQSTLTQVPVVVGYMRPMILLPVSLMTSIPAAQLEAILAHELAHVRRHDFVVNLLQTLVETLFFYHPAVWWLSHQIRVEREHCCDDLVVELLGNRVEYGRALVAIEELRGRSTVLALGAADGSLLSRVRRIIRGGSDRDSNSQSAAVRLRDRWPFALLSLALVGVAIALSMSWTLAAKDDAARELQPAIANLPGDVTVELIGIGFHPSKNREWWKADGSKLEQRPTLKSQFVEIPNTTERDQCREFVVQIRELSNDPSAITVYDVGNASAYSLTDGLWVGETRPGPFKSKTTSIRVGLTTEPYGPFVTIDATGEKQAVAEMPEELQKFYALISPLGVKEIDGQTELLLAGIPYEALHKSAVWELHAIDVDGKKHRSSSESAPATGERHVAFKLPLSRIARFEYRLRPYRHWVTFENVSLHPGQKADVKISVESPLLTDAEAIESPSARLQVKNARGTPAVFNNVVKATIGFPQRSFDGWMELPNREGIVSLEGLPLGTSWLLAAGDSPERLPFAVTIPTEQPLLEQRLRHPDWLAKNVELAVQPVVEVDEKAGELIVIELLNRSKEALSFSEAEIILLSKRDQDLIRGLSPKWLAADREPFPQTRIEAGQTGQMRLNWREWVRKGLWTSRQHEPIAEPGFPANEPGRIWVKAGLGNGGSLPVSVTDPKVILAEPVPQPVVVGPPPEIGQGMKSDLIQWSYDSQELFASIFVWEHQGAKWVPNSPGSEARSSSMAASRKSQQIVVGTGVGTAEVWGATSRKRLGEYRSSPEYAVYAVAISSDDKLVAACGTDGTVALFDRETQQLIVRLGEKATTRMSSLAFSPDNKTLAAMDRYGQIVLWSLGERTRVAEWKGIAGGEDCSVQWSPDCKKLAVSGPGRVTLITAEKGSEPQVVMAPEEVLSRFPKDDGRNNNSGPMPGGIKYASVTAISRNIRTVASIAPDGSIGIWDLRSRKLIQKLPALPERVLVKDWKGPGLRNLVFSPDGQRLACTTERGDVVFWQLAQAAEVKPDGLGAAERSLHSELSYYRGFSPFRLKQFPQAGDGGRSVRFLDDLVSRLPERIQTESGRRFNDALRSIAADVPTQIEATIDRIIGDTRDLPAVYRSALMFNLWLYANDLKTTDGLSKLWGLEVVLLDRVQCKCIMAGLERAEKIPDGLTLRFLELFNYSLSSLKTDDDADWPAKRRMMATLWLTRIEKIRAVIDPHWNFDDLPMINIEAPEGLPAGASAKGIRDSKLLADYEARLEANRRKTERYNQQLEFRRLLAELTPRMEEDLVSLYVRQPFNPNELESLLDKHTADESRRDRIAKSVRLINDILPNGTQLKFGWPDSLAEAGTAGVPALMAAVSDKTYPNFIRYDGAWALGLIGDPRAIDALTAVAEDEVTPAKYKDIAREFVRALREKAAAAEPTPQLRVLHHDGTPATLNHVVQASIGFPDAKCRPWMEHRDRGGLVSLANLPAGKHWLVAAPEFATRTAFQLTMPPTQPMVEQKLFAAPAWISAGKFSLEPTVAGQLATDEEIVVTIRNTSDAVLSVGEEDLSLTMFSVDFRILSPTVIQPEAERPRRLNLAAGAAGVIRINWLKWVQQGLWVSRSGEEIDEPWSVLDVTGRIQVRAEVGHAGAVPVFVTDPKTLLLAVETSPPAGLEFLKPYPKLHGLSLDMTEPQFLEIVKQQELKTRKTVEGEKVMHHIALGDRHTLIVMFDKDAKCSGIQRVRGEDDVPARPKAVLGRESFKGRVMIDGAIPQVPPIKVQPDLMLVIPQNDEDERRNEKATRDTPVVEIPDDSLVISNEGGLANVVVYLRSAPPQWTPTPPPDGPVLSEARNGHFSPRVAVLRIGQELKLKNSMNVPTNFRSNANRSQPFNILTPSKDEWLVEAKSFQSENFPFRMNSDIHPCMQSWIMPLDHPFVAVTDRDGRFEIAGLPPGDYEFRVWHERGGYLEKRLPVRVAEGHTNELTLKYGYDLVNSRFVKPNDAAPIKPGEALQQPDVTVPKQPLDLSRDQDLRQRPKFVIECELQVRPQPQAEKVVAHVPGIRVSADHLVVIPWNLQNAELKEPIGLPSIDGTAQVVGRDDAHGLTLLKITSARWSLFKETSFVTCQSAAPREGQRLVLPLRESHGTQTVTIRATGQLYGKPLAGNDGFGITSTGGAPIGSPLLTADGKLQGILTEQSAFPPADPQGVQENWNIPAFHVQKLIDDYRAQRPQAVANEPPLNPGPRRTQATVVDPLTDQSDNPPAQNAQSPSGQTDGRGKTGGKVVRVVGRIVDDESGLPINNVAWLDWRFAHDLKQMTWEVRLAHPLKDGKIDEMLHEVSQYRRRVMAAGYEPTSLLDEPPNPLPDPPVIERTIRLKKGRLITGVLRDHLGQTVANAKVFFIPKGHRAKLTEGFPGHRNLFPGPMPAELRDNTVSEDLTNDKGEFEFHAAGAGTLAASTDFVDLWPFDLPAEGRPAELELPAPATLTIDLSYWYLRNVLMDSDTPDDEKMGKPFSPDIESPEQCWISAERNKAGQPIADNRWDAIDYSRQMLVQLAVPARTKFAKGVSIDENHGSYASENIDGHFRNTGVMAKISILMPPGKYVIGRYRTGDVAEVVLEAGEETRLEWKRGEGAAVRGTVKLPANSVVQQQGGPSQKLDWTVPIESRVTIKSADGKVHEVIRIDLDGTFFIATHLEPGRYTVLAIADLPPDGILQRFTPPTHSGPDLEAQQELVIPEVVRGPAGPPPVRVELTMKSKDKRVVPAGTAEIKAAANAPAPKPKDPLDDALKQRAQDPFGGTTPRAESGYPVVKQKAEGELSDGWIACEFGLQYRVRAETTSLVAGELPLLFVDVRNRGTFKDMGLEMFQGRHAVVADGQRFVRADTTWGGVTPLDPDGKPLTLAFALSNDWLHEVETKTPLRLTYGKHRISLSLMIAPVYPLLDESQAAPVSRKPIARMLVCRPIEIEVRSGAWSGPPGSLGLENIRREVIAIPVFHSPKVPPNLQRLVQEHQPAAGDFLVKLIKSADEPSLQQAVASVFADAWDSMNREQIESYLHATMTHFFWQRPQYPQGVNALIGMGPRHRPEYLGQPPDRKYSAETITTLHLDGQQVDQPVTYPGLGSLSHWVKTKDLSLGRHTLQLATRFKFMRGTETNRGEFESPEFSFEIVPANTPDDLIAPPDEQLDRLVRESLLFAETEYELSHPPGSENIGRIEPAPSESEKWRPQIRWGENKLGLSSLHCPVWKVAKRLPVDLCFSVEFRVANTDTVIPCNDLVALAADGERRNYFSSFDNSAAVELWKHADKEGFVSGRLVLKPSRSAALTDAKVKRYYGGAIHSQSVRFKISIAQRPNDLGKNLSQEKVKFAFPYFLPASRIVVGEELVDEANALASKEEQIQFLIKLLPPIDQKEKRLSDRQLYAIRLLSLTDSDFVIDPLLDRLDFQHKGDGWPASHALGRLGERSVEPVVKKLESVAHDLQKAIMLGNALIEIKQKKYPMFLDELRRRKDIKLPDKLLNELLDVYRFAPND